jgi:hypothetical protein
LQNNQDTAKLGTALYRWDGEVGALYPRTEEARQRAEIRPFDPHSRQKPKRPDGANRLGVYSKGHPFGRPFSQLQLITPTQKQPLSTPPLLTPNYFLLNLDSSVECLTQRCREAESAENARDLANTMNYASNLLEAKHHLKGETTNCSGHCDKTTNLQFSQHSLPLCASA